MQDGIIHAKLRWKVVSIVMFKSPSSSAHRYSHAEKQQLPSVSCRKSMCRIVLSSTQAALEGEPHLAMAAFPPQLLLYLVAAMWMGTLELRLGPAAGAHAGWHHSQVKLRWKVRLCLNEDNCEIICHKDRRHA